MTGPGPTPAVQRTAEALLTIEHGEHADMYEPQTDSARAALAAGLDVEELASFIRTHRTWTERWAGSNERRYVCLCGEPLPVKRDVLLAPLALAQANHQAAVLRASILGEAS